MLTFHRQCEARFRAVFLRYFIAATSVVIMAYAWLICAFDAFIYCVTLMSIDECYIRGIFKQWSLVVTVPIWLQTSFLHKSVITYFVESVKL